MQENFTLIGLDPTHCQLYTSITRSLLQYSIHIIRHVTCFNTFIFPAQSMKVTRTVRLVLQYTSTSLYEYCAWL